MEKAKIFQTGRSQAVRIPKAFRFSGDEVFIQRVGNGVLLLPIENPWDMMEVALAAFEPSIHLEREEQGSQERDDIHVDSSACAG